MDQVVHFIRTAIIHQRLVKAIGIGDIFFPIIQAGIRILFGLQAVVSWRFQQRVWFYFFPIVGIFYFFQCIHSDM